jgi:hypothetical protein
MLDQPPPDAPPPPPSPAAILSRRKWRALWITGTFSMLALIGMWLFTEIREQRMLADQSEAVGNLGRIRFALDQFDYDYGRFPDDGTAPKVLKNTGSKLTLGNRSSNDYFRQLIAAEILEGEGGFYAKIPGCRHPDRVLSATHALEKGEVGFSYIVGLSSASHPNRPLVVTPLIPGTDRFDPKPFDGYALILTVAGTGSTRGTLYPINSRGEVIDASGKHILDPANPIWGGVKPVIKWPEL